MIGTYESQVAVTSYLMLNASNAIRIDNVSAVQIGHLPRQNAAKLANYIDGSLQVHSAYLSFLKVKFADRNSGCILRGSLPGGSVSSTVHWPCSSTDLILRLPKEYLRWKKWLQTGYH